MNKIWITREGKKIDVKNMSTQHILNCIKALEENRINFYVSLGYFEDNDFQMFDEDEERKINWIKTFENELRNRGEIL